MNQHHQHPSNQSHLLKVLITRHDGVLQQVAAPDRVGDAAVDQARRRPGALQQRLRTEAAPTSGEGGGGDVGAVSGEGAAAQGAGAVEEHGALAGGAVGRLVGHALGGVPGVAAAAPVDAEEERGDQVAHRPGDDHVVVDGDEGAHDAHCVADA